MNARPLLAAALLAATLAPPLRGHGGNYRGPGDTVPSPGGRGCCLGLPVGTSGPHGPPAPKFGSGPGATGPGAWYAVERRLHWSLWWDRSRDAYVAQRLATVRSRRLRDPLAAFEDAFGLAAGRRLRAAHPSGPAAREIGAELESVLRSTAEPEIASSALVALARAVSGGPQRRVDEVRRTLVGFLSDGRETVGERAVLALGVLGDDGAVPLLAELVLDGSNARRVSGSRVSPRRRVFAAYALGLIAARTEDADVRRTIARTLLGVLGQGSGERPFAELQIAAVRALAAVPLEWEPSASDVDGVEGAASVDRASVLDALTAILGAPSAHRGAAGRVRAQTPIAMARLAGGGGSSPALRAYRARLASELIERARAAGETAAVRQSLVIALGWLGCADAPDAERIVSALEELSEDQTDAQVEHLALMALARIAACPGRAALSARIVECLERALVSDDGGRSSWAALALGVAGRAALDEGGSVSPRTRALLRRCFRHRCAPEFRGAYAVALGLIRDAGATPLLLNALEGYGAREHELRGHLCIALGLIGARSAGDALVEIVRRSMSATDLMRRAPLALALHGDPRGPEVLETALLDVEDHASLAAIAAGLGGLREPASVARLASLAAGETYEWFPAGKRGLVWAAVGSASGDASGWRRALFADGWNDAAGVDTLSHRETGTGVLDVL